MKLRFKEDPKEWRKVALLGLIGPSALVGILRWRHVISNSVLIAALVLFALIALCAWARPRWFRGYYRFMTRVGFYAAKVLGTIVLAGIFFLLLTPFGWLMRLFGKDFLQLKSSGDAQTFWQTAKQDGSLDDMF